MRFKDDLTDEELKRLENKHKECGCKTAKDYIDHVKMMRDINSWDTSKL